MLQKLRDKTTGWIATVILGLLIIPFAFFGMESYMSQRVDSHAAQLSRPPAWWQGAPDVWPVTWLWERHEVGSAEYRERFELARMRARDEQGEAFDPRAFESVENKRRVLDELIDEQVLRLAAADKGIVVSDDEVRTTIQQIPAFQVEGKFDPERYQLVLASQPPPRTPREFEQDVRDSLQFGLVPTSLGRSAFVTDAELDRLLRLLGERRDVSYVALPPPAADTAPVSEAQVQAWYKANPADYRSPETVRLEYVEVDGATLAPPAIDEAALRKRYDEQSAKFSTAEQRQVAHILVQVAADASEADRKAAEARARKVAADARAPGADFAALARASSDDAGSKAAGGDLGWIARGSMPGPFEDAAFAMQPGEVRGPVKSDFGWHVIRVGDVRTGNRQAFESVRAQLQEELESSERERVFNELTGKLVDAVYRNPSALEPAAREVGLPVRTTAPFPRRGGQGIAANPAVVRAAFSDTLVQDGTASDPIELGPNHSVLIRVVEHRPERALPLAAVRDAVVAAIRADRQAKAAEAAADALLKAAATKGLAAAAADAGLEVVGLDRLERGNPVPSPQAVEAFFETPRPAAGKAILDKVRGDGSYMVYMIRAVHPGDLTQVGPEQREQLRQQLSTIAGEGARDAYVRAARSKYRIEVVEDRL